MATQGLLRNVRPLRFRTLPNLSGNHITGLTDLRCEPLGRTFQEVRGYWTDSFYVYFAPGVEHELVCQKGVGRCGYLYFARQALGFHATGGVDGVPPQVVLEVLAADNSGDYRAGIDADTKLRIKT